MRTGDEIQIINGIPVFKPKAVEPLGIKHGSKCWGLWVAGRPSRNKPNAGSEHHKHSAAHADNEHKQSDPTQKRKLLPHLVVSPIHPDLWPVAFHLEIKLRDEPGTLARMTQLLADIGINSIFADCATSGYRQATLTIVGTLEAGDPDLSWEKFHARDGNEQAKSLKDELAEVAPILPIDVASFLNRSDRHKDNSPDNNNDDRTTDKTPKNPVFTSPVTNTDDQHRQDLFKRIGTYQMATLMHLWIRIRMEEWKLYQEAKEKNTDESLIDPPGDYFFPSRIVQQGCMPWFLNAKHNGEDGEKIAEQIKLAIKGDNSLKNMARAFRDDAETPLTDDDVLEFIYDAFRGLEDLDSPKVENTPDKSDGSAGQHNEANAHGRGTVEADIAAFFHSRERQEQDPDNESGDRDYNKVDKWLDYWSRDLIRQHWHKPVKLHSMFTLGYYRLWVDSRMPIAEFEYDANSGFLKPINGDTIRAALELHTGEPIEPSFAMAAFHRIDRFIRIEPIHPSISRKAMIQIEVQYSKDARYRDDPHQPNGSHGSPSPKDSGRKSSKGLLSLVANEVQRAGINLLRISNQMTDHDPRTSREHGNLSLVGQADSARIDTLPAIVIEELSERLNQLNNREGLSVKPSVTPYPRKRLFVSSVFDWDRWPDVKAITSEVAKDHGFELITTESHIESITMKVEAGIKESDAMLQFMTLRDEDRTNLHINAQFQPKYDWLFFEFGVARTSGLPIVRVIDADMPGSIQGRCTTVHRDVPAHNVRFSSSLETLERTIRKAILEIQAKVLS